MKKMLIACAVILLVFTGICFGGNDVMWARGHDAWVDGTWADHAFACVNDNGENFCFAYHGGAGVSLGEYISNTWGYGDAYKFKRCASHPTQCKVVYGVEGVCHQEANRMLYSSGKKVTNADGYWLFFASYGHYGNYLFAWKWTNCKTVCNY